MRTDVKIGLIAGFVLLLAVVAYFAWQRPEVRTPVGTENTPQLANNNQTPPPPPSSGMTITPPGAPTPATTPADPFPGMGAGPADTAPGAPLPGVIADPALPTDSVTLAPPPMGATTRPDDAIGQLPSDFGTTPSSPATGPGDIVIGGSPRFTPTPLPPSDFSSTPTPPLTSPTPASASTYAVKKGDTLTAIAKAHNVSLSALQKANPGVNPNRLKIGQSLKIPAASAAASTPTRTPTRTPAASPARTPTAASPTITAKPGGTYVVRRGDTLESIARAVYGTPAAANRILRANRGEIRNANDIKAGTRLTLPQ